MSLTLSGTEILLFGIVASTLALFAGGLVKGIVGIGLPLIAIPLMAAFLPLRDAIAIMYGPVIVTNIWQVSQGGYFLIALKRFWPMMTTVIAGAWLGAQTLVSIDQSWLTGIVGSTVAAFSLLNLLNPSLRVPARHELWLSIVIGFTGGFFGGLTLFIGPAVIMFLVALQVRKEEFIGTIGLIYLIGLVPTGFFYVESGVLRMEHFWPTLLALIPVVIGMAFGQYIRRFVNEDTFRKALLAMLVLIGLNMVRQAIF